MTNFSTGISPGATDEFDLDELLPPIPADYPVPAGSPMYNSSGAVDELLVYFDGQWHRKPYLRRAPTSIDLARHLDRVYAEINQHPRP